MPATPRNHEPEQPEPTDPRLDALLDEALAPQDWPDAARQRAYAAVLAANTAAQSIAHDAPTADPDASPVLARIGGSLAWAVAAAVALGTAIVAISLTGSDPSDDGNAVIVEAPDASASPAALADAEALGSELQVWSAYARAVAESRAWDETAWVDDELELLHTQVALTSSEELWGHDDPWESLEVADLQRELDAMAYPLTTQF